MGSSSVIEMYVDVFRDRKKGHTNLKRRLFVRTFNNSGQIPNVTSR